jgi:hypothetical protein
MYSATVLLTIDQFVPMTGSFADSPSIVAKVWPPQDISPPPHPEPPVFSGDGESITITLPKGYKGSVQLIYQLPDPRYMLLGAAFKAEDSSVGQVEFPTVAISRDPYGSEMMVTNSCAHSSDGKEYHYVILVQEVATANIGLIDPDIETDGTE